MSWTCDTQMGATLTLSGLTAANAVVDIPAVAETGGAIDITHLGSTGQRCYIPHDLTDVEEFTITAQNAPNGTVPTKNTVVTVTITGPVPSGLSSGESWTGTCIVTRVTSPQYQSATPALQTMQVAMKPDGGGSGSGTAWTRTAAS